MLAKEVKIKRLKRQRDYIETELRNVVYHDVEDSTFACMGIVYRENIDYFQEQGYEVTMFKVRTPEGFFMNIYTFEPNDVELSPEELQEAENYDYTADVEVQKSLEEENDDYEDYDDEEDYEAESITYRNRGLLN